MSKLSSYKNVYLPQQTSYATKPAGNVDQPWYMDVANFISRPQRAITGALANITDTDPNTTLLGGLWGGISGKERKDTVDILKNLGFNNNVGQLDLVDIFGFAGDVALDPLTYLTFGGASAAKAGAKAMADEAARQAARYGVRLSGNSASKSGAKYMSNSIKDLVESSTVEKLSKGRTLNPDLEARILDIAKRRAAKADEAVSNAGRKARFEGQNALINFDIPFTNITKSFGKKGKWTSIVDKKADASQVAGVVAMFNKAGGFPTSPRQIKQVLQKRYGKSKISELTQQELDDLQRLKNFKYSEEVFKTDITKGARKKVMASELEAVLKRINPASTETAATLSKKYKKKEDMFKALNDTIKNANKTRRANSKLPDEVLDFLGRSRFQQDMGGQSMLGDKVRWLNPFNKRTVFDNTDPLINRAADVRTNIDNRILSQTRQIEKDVEVMQGMAKGLSTEELGSIGFIIEKQFPKEYGDLDGYLTKVVGNTDNKQKLLDLANHIEKRMANYSKQEIEEGLLTKFRTNYFPHIQDYGAQIDAGIRKGIDENINDPTIGKFLKQSSRNPYVKSRTAFATLAEVDDTIAELQKKVNAMSPTDKDYQKLVDQIQLLKFLFKKDSPIEIFMERSKVAIRSAAMKSLQTQYEMDGLIRRNVRLVVNPKTRKAEVPQNLLDEGFRRLDNDEVEALGLSKTLGRENNEVILIQNDLYKMLTEATKFSEIDAVNRTLEMSNAVTNFFKVLYTSAVPKHYFYNLVGSVFNNTVAGVGVDAYGKSARLLQKLKNGTLTEEESKLINRALDEGVLNQTGYADLVRPDVLVKGRKNLQDKEVDFYKKIDKYNQEVVDNVVSKTLRRTLGDPTDNFTRLAHFIHVLETTKSVKLASESVRKHLFNYNEVTKTDRIVKIYLPFWNWMKNNIPMQLHKLVTEPRILATYDKARRETFGDEEPSDFPSYIQEGFIRTGENAFYNPRLPLQDLQQLGSPVKTLFNALTPVLKMPTEGMTNYQFFSEKPISYRKKFDPEIGYFSNEDSRAELWKYINANLGIVGDAADVVTNVSLPQDDPMKTDNLQMLLNNLFGKTSSVRKE